ncbi:MAG: serine hydrolase domain-containing protein [Geminicoccaceae bacterium]
MSRRSLSTVMVAATVLKRANDFALRVVSATFLLGLLSGVPVSSASTPAVSPDYAAGSALRPVSQSELEALLAKTARDLHVPGAVVHLRTPQAEFAAGYGTTRLGSGIRPRSHTFFRIASITKTMTSAVILQLAQEGKLRLGDRISKYVPGVPNGANITLAELLEMRSGLYDYTSAPEMAGFLDRHPTKVWTPEELLAIAFARPPNFAPGTAYEYSNTNYALLGLVAEKVDCRPLAMAMRERLFRPLGMRNTLLPPSTSNRIPDPYSHGYLYGSSSVVTTGIPNPPYDAKFLAAVEAGKIQPKDYTGVNHSFATAAGGVISTANDLDTWIRALVGGRVLNAKYQRIWRDSLKPATNGLDYGYGINRLRWGHNTFYLHGGETVGYNSEAGYDPVNRLTLVLWTNLTVSPTDKLTANALMLKVLDRIYKQSPLKP